MQLSFSIVVFSFGCLCLGTIHAEVLVGNVRGNIGYFDLGGEAAPWTKLFYPKVATWPPQRKLLALGQYNNASAMFVGGDMNYAAQQQLTIVQGASPDQLKLNTVNVSLPKDECGLWQLIFNKLNGKLYAFTQVKSVSEFRLYELAPASGEATHIRTYPHDLPTEHCWDIFGGVALDPVSEEILLYASSHARKLWDTWRISLRSGGEVVKKVRIAQSMLAPVLSRDMKTFYSVGYHDSAFISTFFQAVDASTGQVIHKKNSSISWVVQRNVAALDEENGLYVVSGTLSNIAPHLLLYSTSSLDFLEAPYAVSYNYYQDLWDLMFVPV